MSSNMIIVMISCIPLMFTFSIAMIVPRTIVITFAVETIRTTPKQILGDVFNLKDREEAILHKYTGLADDLVSLRVDDVECFANGAVDVHSTFDGMDIKVRHDVSFAAADMDYPFSSGRSLAEILQAWRSPPRSAAKMIPLLFVVEPGERGG